MRLDLSAIPLLGSSDPIPGAGANRSEAEWAIALAELRPRFAALSYRELCSTLRRMEFGDLLGLVISPPYDSPLLETLCRGLSAPVATMLIEDCNRFGESYLAADLAFGTFTRSAAALDAIEASRATPAQLEQLRPLALQLADLPESTWHEHLPVSLFLPLIALTGGITGPFGQRLCSLASPKGWAFLVEDYRDNATEPLNRKDAEQALTGIPALLQGQPWPLGEEAISDDALDDLLENCSAQLDSPKPS